MMSLDISDDIKTGENFQVNIIFNYLFGRIIARIKNLFKFIPCGHWQGYLFLKPYVFKSVNAIKILKFQPCYLPLSDSEPFLRGSGQQHFLVVAFNTSSDGSVRAVYTVQCGMKSSYSAIINCIVGVLQTE
jgi:hypothetical protein